jgi:hypothetical protein
MWELSSAASLFYRVANNTTAGSGAIVTVIGVLKFEADK